MYTVSSFHERDISQHRDKRIRCWHEYEHLEFHSRTDIAVIETKLGRIVLLSIKPYEDFCGVSCVEPSRGDLRSAMSTGDFSKVTIRDESWMMVRVSFQ